MTYAAWTKGTAALLLAIRASAEAEGVDEALSRSGGCRCRSLPRRRSSARAAVRRMEGLALGRRDGGDRRDVRGRPTSRTGSTARPRRCSTATRGNPGPRTTRPGSAPVCSPSRSTSVPFTTTCATPVAYRCGSSYVAWSWMLSGSKTTTSAKEPGSRTSAVREPQVRGGQRRQPAHRLLERHDRPRRGRTSRAGARSCRRRAGACSHWRKTPLGARAPASPSRSSPTGRATSRRTLSSDIVKYAVADARVDPRRRDPSPSARGVVRAPLRRRRASCRSAAAAPRS